LNYDANLIEFVQLDLTRIKLEMTFFKDE